ncbi:MAG: hypothetical protein QOD06_1492, partial [Candidatus Binatota bacterium]|nr:hypothetical protein [Candidatus Binatota bacterium]
PESDAFRFDTDADFFSYLRGRCPDLATPDLTRASYRPWIPTHADEKVSTLEPAPAMASRWEESDSGGILSLFSRIFAR